MRGRKWKRRKRHYMKGFKVHVGRHRTSKRAAARAQRRKPVEE